jgi:hypothetical protein
MGRLSIRKRRTIMGPKKIVIEVDEERIGRIASKCQRVYKVALKESDLIDVLEKAAEIIHTELDSTLYDALDTVVFDRAEV